MTFTFLTGIVSYLVAWAILGQDNHDELSPESSMDFTVRNNQRYSIQHDTTPNTCFIYMLFYKITDVFGVGQTKNLSPR